MFDTDRSVGVYITTHCTYNKSPQSKLYATWRSRSNEVPPRFSYRGRDVAKPSPGHPVVAALDGEYLLVVTTEDQYNFAGVIL